MVLFFGDSHIRCVRKLNEGHQFLFGSGASLTGLFKGGKHDPTTLIAHKEFTDGDKLIISLGEVDCGYLFWIHNENLSEQIKKVIKKYEKFMRNIPARCFPLSVPPPVPVDYKNYGIRKKSSDISYKQRVEATCELNEKLKRFDNFIDITTPVMNGFKPKEEYIVRNKKGEISDHHLKYKKYGRLIVEQTDNFLHNS